eukprot:3103083-Amphidinium_carterae.1
MDSTKRQVKLKLNCLDLFVAPCSLPHVSRRTVGARSRSLESRSKSMQFVEALKSTALVRE